MVGDSRVLSFDYHLIEALHVVSPERWMERTHLVKYAAQGPNITLGVVRHVSPNFGARVVGRTCLSVTEPLFHDL